MPALPERAPARRGPASPRRLCALRRHARVSPLVDGRVRLAALVGFLVLVADQVSKAVVDAAMSRHESIDLLPFLALTYVRNTGAAFGILAAAPPSVRLPLFLALTVGAIGG